MAYQLTVWMVCKLVQISRKIYTLSTIFKRQNIVLEYYNYSIEYYNNIECYRTTH